MNTVRRNEKGHWLPGSVPNPTGRPGLPAELRIKASKCKEEVYETVIEYFKKDIETIEQLKDDKSISGLERMIIGVMYKAFNGDKPSLEFFLSMFIGKIQEPIQVTGQENKEVLASYTEEQFIEHGERVIQRLKTNLQLRGSAE